jgi:hypothetical protein
MLVDADNPGDPWGYEGLDQFYNWSLQNHSATVFTWDVYGNNKAAQGKPTAVDMASYSAVIWVPSRNINYDGTEFDAADEAQVQTYLTNNGGNFMISNVFYTDWTAGGTAMYAPGDFAYDALGMIGTVQWGSSLELSVNETSGDPVYGGVGVCPLDWMRDGWPGEYGGGPPGASDEPTAGLGTISFFNDVGTSAGIRFDSGTYKTVFLGFPFEVLAPANADDIMARTLDWFVPPGGGSSGQLTHGALANETIINWHVWDDTAGVYLDNTTDYTLNPATGAIDFVVDLSGNTIIVFYNYTTTMVEGTDYNVLTTYNYMNGKVNITIPFNPAEDQIKANYTWYPFVDSGTLTLFPDANDGGPTEIRNDNYVIWWDSGGAPINWIGNYVLDNATGDITFNNPLGPGETVAADYTLFNPKFFGKTFTWPLDHGSGVDGMNIATADFHLIKNAADMLGSQYNLNPVPGTVDILATGVLTYDDALTADYWYYDPAAWPPSMTFQLGHGALANESVIHSEPYDFFARVTNAITGFVTDYDTTTSMADLTNGTFQLPGYSPGDAVIANYTFYDPAEIVNEYDLMPEIGWGGDPDDTISEGTFTFYLNGALVSTSNYDIDFATGHIVLNDTAVPLDPHDSLTANYNYLKYLGGGDFSLDQTDGILTIQGDVVAGDLVLADYTYETYSVLDLELGQVNILNNLDPANDTLTMSFDYRRFDELIERSNEQMTYEMRAMYIKDAQAFIAEELPCIPLFSSKVASAFNNTRYEGWDAGSMPGGILNFWTFTNARNKILGEMQVSISAFPGFVTEGEDIDLEVRVEDLDGNSIPNVNIEFEGSGTFGAVTTQWEDGDGNGAWDDDETGFYISTLTAPQTSISRTITITAMATRPSYVMGSGQVQLTVHPIISQFDIDIDRGLTSIPSGNQTDITITVLDSVTQEAVSGVELALAVSPLGLGGSLQDTTGTTDGVGEFSTVFMTANVTIDTTFTITVTASLDGYIDETQTSSISVSRDPNIQVTSDKGFLGLPAPPFMIVLVLLCSLSISYAVYRRKKR